VTESVLRKMDVLLTYFTEDFKTFSGFSTDLRVRKLIALIILSAWCNGDYFSLGDLFQSLESRRKRD
jgi:hypothetical protein